MDARQLIIQERLNVESLSPGTIVEFDCFATLVVGENMLLVFDSETEYVREGSLLYFTHRGENDWVVSISENDGWTHNDFWIKRDWNGRVSTREYFEHDWWDDWPVEWDDELDARLRAYEEYDY